jgi:GntR family transcriptional regulator/MocR family aminotransferase
VESKPRKGLFVTTFDNDLIINQRGLEKLESKTKKVQVNTKIDFNSGKVDLEHFPYAIWRKLTVQSLYEDQEELFYNGNPQGEQILSEQIAAHFYASRGVRCSAEQIIIGAGTQVLVGLLCMLIGKDHIYAFENPGFHRTRITLQDMGVDLVPIPLDENGMSINHIVVQLTVLELKQSCLFGNSFFLFS